MARKCYRSEVDLDRASRSYTEQQQEVESGLNMSTRRNGKYECLESQDKNERSSEEGTDTYRRS